MLGKGRPRAGQDYIVFGELAVPHEFPWMVLIQGGCVTDPTKHMDLCGGSLITPFFVLSAWHCIPCEIIGNDHSFALIGTDLWTTESLKSDEAKVLTQILEPDYEVIPIIQGKTPNAPYKNDLGLYLLARDVTLSPKVCPILLPRPDDVFQWNDAWVAGWGKTESGKVATYLQKCEQYVDHVDKFTSETYRTNFSSGVVAQFSLIFEPLKVVR